LRERGREKLESRGEGAAGREKIGGGHTSICPKDSASIESRRNLFMAKCSFESTLTASKTTAKPPRPTSLRIFCVIL
jgi:hypothetical protein